MQYFFYDPILGLQYFCYENIIEIEFDHIPDFKIGDVLDLMYAKGLVLKDYSNIVSAIEIGSIGSNMFDCDDIHYCRFIEPENEKRILEHYPKFSKERVWKKIEEELNKKSPN